MKQEQTTSKGKQGEINSYQVIIVIIALIFFFGSIIVLPEYQVEIDLKKRRILKKDIPSQVNEYRKTVIQILGGAVLAFGLYLTWRRIKAMEDTVKVTEEGQITDRFSKAIEHLGSEQLSIRLGGIYALERIARDSKADHWTAMEVLSAFIRNYKPDIASQDDDTLRAFFNDYGSENKEKEILEDSKGQNKKEGLPKLPTDVQAALTVIGKRNIKNDPMIAFLDLSGSFLQSANLRNANLLGADLRGANLLGADLRGANLEGAKLWAANLEGANLRNANLEEADLEEANLERANFWAANLGEAKLWKANLERANLGAANLGEAKLWKANLEGANLEGAYLGEAKLGEANLEGAYLGEANLERANLWEANLEGANLKEANLLGAELSRAKLEGATAYEHQKEYFQERGVDISKMRFIEDPQPHSSD